MSEKGSKWDPEEATRGRRRQNRGKQGWKQGENMSLQVSRAQKVFEMSRNEPKWAEMSQMSILLPNIVGHWLAACGEIFFGGLFGGDRGLCVSVGHLVAEWAKMSQNEPRWAEMSQMSILLPNMVGHWLAACGKKYLGAFSGETGGYVWAWVILLRQYGSQWANTWVKVGENGLRTIWGGG